ncbi:MAG: DegV family protein [Syntrophomonas sp.]
MGVKIATDTSCDLPDEELRRYNIELIPLRITFDDGQTFLDRIEISPSAFVEKMVKSKCLPKTAAPDPDAFASCFQKGLKVEGQVLFMSLSSGLSSTYQTAVLASNMLGSHSICIFDTLAASLGTGIAAIKAARLAALGMNVHAIVEKLSVIRKTRQLFFTLDTLENVVKGGRLSPIQGMAGNVLNIKPILKVNDRGVPDIVGKVRGRNKAIRRLVDIIGEVPGLNPGEKMIGVSHVACPEDAARLAMYIEERYRPAEPVIIGEMAATIGIYAGVGGLMVNLL